MSDHFRTLRRKGLKENQVFITALVKERQILVRILFIRIEKNFTYQIEPNSFTSGKLNLYWLQILLLSIRWH